MPTLTNYVNRHHQRRHGGPDRSPPAKTRSQCYIVGYKGYKRYIRGVVNVTGHALDRHALLASSACAAATTYQPANANTLTNCGGG